MKTFLVALTLLCTVASAHAGVVNGFATVAPIASSFCTLAPVTATAFGGGCAVPAGALCVNATVTGANVNWRDDGTAPTATAGTGGQQVANGGTLWYCGKLSAIQFIQQSATATVAASFYK